jgi:uncharacterized membrane protein HdeD (DUF308 family)
MGGVTMNAITRSPAESRPVYPWWLVLLQGVGAVLLGLVLLSALGVTVELLAQALGWFWMVVATAAAVSIFIDRRLWAAKLVSAVLGVIAAALVIDHPLWAAALVPVTLTWILGLYGIIAGATYLARRTVMDGAGWALGVLGLTLSLLGVALLSTPVITTSVLTGVMAAVAILGGLVAIVGALGRRPAERVEREIEREEALAGVAPPLAGPQMAEPPAAERPVPEPARSAIRVYPAPEAERQPEVERDGGPDVAGR